MSERDPAQSVQGPSLRQLVREVVAPLRTHKRRTLVRVTVTVALALLTTLTVTRVAFDISVDNLRGQLSYDEGCYDGVAPEVYGRYLDELSWDPMRDTNAGIALDSLASFVSFSLVDTHAMERLETRQRELYNACRLLDDERGLHAETHNLLGGDDPQTRRVVITLAKIGARAL